jgi:DNA-binding Xre family transcriptional regulator
MNIEKYFWDLKEKALKETKGILKDPGHPKFTERVVTLLSRCDKPEELFSIIPRRKFVEIWPRIRTYWIKRIRRSDFRDWWETIYEQILEKDQHRRRKAKGGTPVTFRTIGMEVRDARIQKGLSQKQLALRIGMKQPDISRIEEGKKNITLFTLTRLCKVLGIEKIDVRLPG